MKTPVLFLIFNRPDTTRRVFAEIRKVKPEKLFIAADGPRPNRPDDMENCRLAREIAQKIDWPCEIKTLFREENLGCGVALSSAISWFFENVEKGIILEDDCLPNPSFFPFCEELLERYKDDERIMEISGNFVQQKNRGFKTKDSYYGSILPFLWGWATWRRAWKKFDFNLTMWPEVKKSKILVPVFKNPAAYERWSGVWDQYRDEKVNNWDAQWVFVCAMNRGICINPTVNLVSNIGFGGDTTHVKAPAGKANVPTHTMTFPLNHPSEIKIDYQADAYTFRHHFGIDKKLHYRLLRPVKTAFPDLYESVRRLLGKNKGFTKSQF